MDLPIWKCGCCEQLKRREYKLLWLKVRLTGRTQIAFQCLPEAFQERRQLAVVYLFLPFSKLDTFAQMGINPNHALPEFKYVTYSLWHVQFQTYGYKGPVAAEDISDWGGWRSKAVWPIFALRYAEYREAFSWHFGLCIASTA